MKIQAENKTINIRVGKVTLEADSILRLTIDYTNGLLYDDLHEILAAIQKICNGNKAFVLAESINYQLPSREVRNYSAGQEAAKIISAVASLSTHPLVNIAANFFLKINKPPFPFKLFSSEKEAISWLKKLQE